jgi:hypothetical protein
MDMPSPRAVAGMAAALVAVGIVGLGFGAVMLVANRGAGGGGLRGLGSAIGQVLLFGGLAAVLGGTYLLTRGRTARTRARTTVPGLQPSTSMLPGGALFFVGIVSALLAVLGTTWMFVPAVITGTAGMILFARSGSPDEPA